MFIVLVTLLNGPTKSYGVFTTIDAANYFVDEFPHKVEGFRTDRVEILDLTPLASMGIDPASGDGTYRYFS